MNDQQLLLYINITVPRKVVEFYTKGESDMINRKIAISIIALFAIITVVMGFFILKMEINVSSEFLLPEKSPSRENMSKMEDLFGSEKQIIIVIKTDGLFKEDNSLMIYNFLQKLSSIEGVVSYNSYQDAAKVSLIGGTNVEPYFVEGLPNENASEILNNPLYLDNLLNENGEVALIPINVTDSADVNVSLKWPAIRLRVWSSTPAVSQ